VRTGGSTDFARRAEELLDDVDRDPAGVAVEAQALAETTDDAATASIAWRAAGIGLRMTGRITDALTALDTAVSAAETAGDGRLAGLARISRAAPRFISGDMAGGEADVNAALDALDGADRGVAMFQRAQYLDVIEAPEATAAFDAAIELLTGSPSHAKYLGHALGNRGIHHSMYGRLDAARRDLAAARDIWDGLGLDALAATAVHNLGAAAMFAGEFVDALDHFESAQRRTSTLGREQAASGRDYCDALLAVGLAAEARDRAVELAAASAAGGDVLAAAELQLLGAHAALQIGDPAATEHLAGAALDRFEVSGRPGWAAQARLALARAAIERGTADIAEIDRLADDLVGRGWSDAALHARLLATSVVGRSTGSAADARARLDALAGALRSARAERRLQATSIEAALECADGDHTAARRAVRRGLAIVEHEQRAVGAVDARAHFASHAADLLATGRTVAVSQRNARAAWRDLERMRALSLRRPRVSPVDDAELGELLSRLRHVSVDLALEEPGAVAWRSLEREQRRLQRQIADHVRRTPGAGDDAGDIEFAEIAEVLDAHGAAMVSFDVVDGRLWAFRFDTRMRRVDCGAASEFTDRVDAAALAVRRLSRRTAAAHSVTLGVAQLTELTAWFATRLPLPAGDGPVVLIVPNELAGVPWAAIASLAGRPFALAPSAWSWWQAMQSDPERDDRAAAATFVAGPRLSLAASEVSASAAAHRDAVVLSGQDATAARTANAIGSSRLTHVAAHYSPRRGNPLFSSFELADGPWFLHDLIRCPAMPETWVVPSCESAAGEAPVAGELLGLSSVLLGAGARSVVMSSGLVPDDEVTVATMSALHRRLAGGAGPAGALADALADAGGSPAAAVLRATLTCHGAW
jgi:hypothetical protein